MKPITLQYSAVEDSYQLQEHPGKDGKEKITIRCLLKDLPLAPNGANIRDADLHSDAVKSMRRQLATKADGYLFEGGNGGIDIAVDSLSYNAKTGILTVTVDPEEGCFQGNHTQCLASDIREHPEELGNYPGFDVAECTVRFFRGFSTAEITNLAEAKNTVRRHTDVDKLARRGAFTQLEKELKESTLQTIRERSGSRSTHKTKPYTYQDVVQRLALLDNKMFPAEKGVHPINVYVGPKAIVRRFAEGAFDHLIPLANDVIHLDRIIAESVVTHKGYNTAASGKWGRLLTYGCPPEKQAALRRPTLRLDGTTIEGSVHSDWVFPCIAAMRTLLKDNKWPTGETVDTLWGRYGKALLWRSWQLRKGPLKNFNKNNLGRNPALWAELSAIVMSLPNFIATLAELDTFQTSKLRKPKAP